MTMDSSKISGGSSRSSRRTHSLSSLSSISSMSSGSFYFLDDPPLSPATSLSFLGVPFSWEKLPGIPKNQNCTKKEDSTANILPLPPPKSRSKTHYKEPGNRRKCNPIETLFEKDPFFAALVECSKDEQNAWRGDKVARSTSDRFSLLNLYGSCKSTCNVTESIVPLPRSRRTSYPLIDRHFR